MIVAAYAEQDDIDAVALEAGSDRVRHLFVPRRIARIERDPGQKNEHAEDDEQRDLDGRLRARRFRLELIDVGPDAVRTAAVRVPFAVTCGPELGSCRHGRAV